MRFINFIVLVLGGLGILSCEKVIDLRLKDADATLVIEGNISDQEREHYVYISQTVPFSADGTANPVSEARVSISEEVVGTDQDLYFYYWPLKDTARYFVEVAPGVYRITNYDAHPGRKYHLRVVVGDQTYEASSWMSYPVGIDSIGTVWSSFLGDRSKQVAIIYRDPPGEPNYYRYLLYVNGVPLKQLFIDNDKYTDGKQVQRDFSDDDITLKTGDEVLVEQQCLDEAVYTYFNGLNANNSGAVSPANPISNFSNGALGYFSAHSISRAFVRIE